MEVHKNYRSVVEDSGSLCRYIIVLSTRSLSFLLPVSNPIGSDLQSDVQDQYRSG